MIKIRKMLNKYVYGPSSNPIVCFLKNLSTELSINLSIERHSMNAKESVPLLIVSHLVQTRDIMDTQ